MRIPVRICSILPLIVLISCSGQPAPAGTAASSIPAFTSTPVPSAEAPDTAPQPTERVQPGQTATAIPKVKLIKDLTGSAEQRTLLIQGQEYPSTFVEIDMHPYGFFIPDTMQEFDYEDGSELGLNKSEFIALSEVSRLANPDNLQESLKFGGDVLFQDKDLMQYEEYVGSAGDGGDGRRVDGFVFKHDDTPDMLMYFMYFNRNKEAVLPVFLEVAGNIRYLGQQ
ncbi:hypothetical protein [Paenibacillus sp. MMS20-IR301]|uniref:type IV pilus assembly protein FimV n=1 Tax=Paenibacillus sp. MMS20-IR301 TaxID=2895946 RepID=UPI0028EE10A7|nr:hypothetical protein [Paenibacillus sp. MMS20-IR301]WNS41898.1 hypothetical protein LOS79_23210 [Paenibacillus sp. MMS20-IR301]